MVYSEDAEKKLAMSPDTAAELLYLADIVTERLMRSRYQFDPAVCDLRRAVDAAYAEQARKRAAFWTDERLKDLIETVREA